MNKEIIEIIIQFQFHRLRHEKRIKIERGSSYSHF